MSLYDDIDENKAKSVTGWSSGIKLLQSQLHVKKAIIPQPRKIEPARRPVPAAIPSSVLHAESSHKPEIEPKKVFVSQGPPLLAAMIPKQEKSMLMAELDWDLSLEYDPHCPNDYDKLFKDRKERRETEIEETEKKRRPREELRDNKPRERTNTSGFAGRYDEEDEEPVTKKSQGGGVAIAPPPSLQETSQPSPNPVGCSPSGAGALGVAAKIMAKYGFKEGQGLGRQQQGIAAALQVEKTSKRGGRIINETEVMPAPSVSSPPPTIAAKPELSIAEMMKNPSKVICLRNMVGPGEVDSDLEPEVREECQSKYGEVNKVAIREFSSVPDDEAVRIFVEFKRIESAIKALIDLNGRFFGGRQVKACFYDLEKFLSVELND